MSSEQGSVIVRIAAQRPNNTCSGAVLCYNFRLMTDQRLKILSRRFIDYVNTFRDSSGELIPMLQLKLTHTKRVVQNARRIMQGERWQGPSLLEGELCALLHDIGRFSQFTEFGTFRDSESVDHALRGVEIIQKLDILEGVPAPAAQRIIESVQWHNKKALPSEMENSTAALAHLVRDADKLDIFKVMIEAVKDGSIETNPEITWGLSIKGAPNPEVVNAVIKGKPVDYSQIHALSDFILIQVGWVINGFHYRTALQITGERKVVEFHHKYLKTLTASPAIDLCCDAAYTALRSV